MLKGVVTMSKSNKEIIYDFIQLHFGQQGETQGLSTQYIAKTLNMQRSNVSSILNGLVEEGRVQKTSGRPVLYSLSQREETREECFHELIGYDGSLRRAVSLSKAAVLYPQRSLNSLIIGEKGTGKKQLAKLMYQFAIDNGIIERTAQFVDFSSKRYVENEAGALDELVGNGERNGYMTTVGQGVLYIDDIQCLGPKVRCAFLEYFERKKKEQETGKGPIIIVSCQYRNSSVADEYAALFPIIIELPILEQRPLSERFAMIQRFFLNEAMRIKRKLIVKADLLRCLLSYDCPANCMQLKGDIKIGCANAFVREYKSKDDLHLFLSDFEPYVRKGILRQEQHEKEICALVPIGCECAFYGDSNEMRTVLAAEQEEEPVVGSRKKPVIVFAFTGEGVAKAVRNAIVQQTQLEDVYCFEILAEKGAKERYHSFKNYIMQIDHGCGVIVVYDGDYISDMLLTMEEELNIVIRQLCLPIISLGAELVRKAARECNVDTVFQSVMKSTGLFDRRFRKYIIVLCTTGKGSAQELKRYLEKYGQVEDMEIIPLALSDPAAIKEEIGNLMKTGMIECIVGTYDPKLYSLPFLSITEVFQAPKERLRNLLLLKGEEKKDIDYEGMIDYLKEQLEQTNAELLHKALPELIEKINEQIYGLSIDSKVGLFMHISCCIERMRKHDKTPKNIRKDRILSTYYSAYRTLLKLLKPVEKAFDVIFNEDEIANLLMIIFQL